MNITRHYKNATDELFVNPILSNHSGLIEITEAEFNDIVTLKNTPAEKTPYQLMSELEATRTPRREREARLGLAGAQQWLDDLDAEIEALRPIA